MELFKIVQLRNAHHRIDDSEGISEVKAFFLEEVRRIPKFFLTPPKLQRRKEDRTQRGVTVSTQTLTLKEDEIGYGVRYESNRYIDVIVSYFPVLGLYALL